MIKIIEEGRKLKPTIRVYTVACPYCGCVFECDHRDFKWQSRSMVLDARVSCPCCGEELRVDPYVPYRDEEIKEETKGD